MIGGEGAGCGCGWRRRSPLPPAWWVRVSMWRPYLVRINGSNVLAAPVDAVVFPWLAFGAVGGVVAGLFGAKVVGGSVWAVVLRGR
jgi:hypothetical protein